MDTPGVAIIGCGLIGQKRLQNLPPGTVRVACDLDIERARRLASQSPGCKATSSVSEALALPGVAAVMIATVNSALAPLAVQALEAGKHVLVEKPVGVSVQEIEQLDKVASKNKLLVRAAYNHRYHPACLKALEIWRSGALGPLMFVRGRYGQGGRVGYEKEWRADPKLSGGAN